MIKNSLFLDAFSASADCVLARVSTMVAAISFVMLTMIPFGTAFASQLEGYHFDDVLKIDGQSLVLNGLGVRAVAIFKGYIAALYVREPSHNADLLVGQSGPKRVTMRMLLATDSSTFVKALDSGVRKNYSAEQVAAMQSQIDRFDAAMQHIGHVHAGDVVDIEFLPGRGTHLIYNGKATGQWVPGVEFYQAVLKIFIGMHPIDLRLKRAMLGLSGSGGE